MVGFGLTVTEKLTGTPAQPVAFCPVRLYTVLAKGVAVIELPDALVLHV